jgi:hypothetical protein
MTHVVAIQKSLSVQSSGGGIIFLLGFRVKGSGLKGDGKTDAENEQPA